jgi:Type II secretion system (T2SS), protein G
MNWVHETHAICHAAFLAAALLIVILALALVHKIPREQPKSRVENERKAFGAAMQMHRIEFDRYPSGDKLQILEALAGNNPRNAVFLQLGPRSTNLAGEFIDTWGTPYEYEITSQTNFLIRSAGPNQSFDNSNDVVFDSVQNALVTP